MSRALGEVQRCPSREQLDVGSLGTRAAGPGEWLISLQFPPYARAFPGSSLQPAEACSRCLWGPFR